MKTITKKELAETIAESIDRWDLSALVDFANDVMLEEAEKHKYAIIEQSDDEDEKSFAFATDREDDADIDFDQSPYRIID